MLRSFRGNSANNTITLNDITAAKEVFLSNGGTDTLVIDTLGIGTAPVTVYDFQAGNGAGGDIVSICFNVIFGSLLHVTGPAGNIANSGALNVAQINNVDVFDDAAFQVIGGFTDSTVKAAINAGLGTTTISYYSDRYHYFGLDNGSDTALYRMLLTDVGGIPGEFDDVNDIFSLQQVLVLVGVGDVSLLDTSNFS